MDPWMETFANTIENGNKWWREWNGVDEPPNIYDVEEPENPY